MPVATSTEVTAPVDVYSPPLLRETNMLPAVPVPLSLIEMSSFFLVPVIKSSVVPGISGLGTS